MESEMAEAWSFQHDGPGWYLERVTDTIAGRMMSTLGGPFKSDRDALAMLHRVQSSSWETAIRWEGYVVRLLDDAGVEVDRVHSTRREARKRDGGRAHERRHANP